MLTKSEFEKINASLFNRLKNISNDPESVYQLTKDYEDLQLKIELSDSLSKDEKSTLLLIVGRAISNIIEKIKSFGWFRNLKDIDISTINKNTHFVFLGHRGGLCNRLRALAGLEIICHKLGYKFSWSWYATLSCTGIIPRNSKSLSLAGLIKARIIFQENEQDIVIIDDPNSLGFFYNKFSKLLQTHSYNDIYREYVKVSKLLLDSLIYYYGLSSKVFDFIAHNSTNVFGAMHIRQTDFIDHFKKKYPDERLPTVKEYISYVQSHPDMKFFLSTDEQNIRDEIKTACNNVFMWEHKYDANALRQTGFEETLLDLAVLLNSNCLIITPHSSFSQYIVEAGVVTPIKLT